MLIFRIGQGASQYSFGLSQLPIHHLLMCAINSQPVYPWCKTKHRWYPIHVHFHDGARIVSLLFLSLKVASTSFIDLCNQWLVTVRKMQGQKSLMICWHSSPRLGRECVTIVFPTEGSQYILYRCLRPITAKIMQDANPKIIQTASMLNITVGQWTCRFLFCLMRLPIRWSATIVVSATVPSSRVGSGSGSNPEPNCCNESYHTKTRTVAIGPVLPPKTRHFNFTSLGPIRYLSSDRIMTRSIRKLCSFMRSFTSHF